MQPRDAAWRPVDSIDRLLTDLANLELDFLFFPLTKDDELDFISRFGPLDFLDKIFECEVDDLFAVEFLDDVALLDACFLGGAVSDEARALDPLGRLLDHHANCTLWVLRSPV